jgi:hypothetical protein
MKATAVPRSGLVGESNISLLPVELVQSLHCGAYSMSEAVTELGLHYHGETVTLHFNFTHPRVQEHYLHHSQRVMGTHHPFATRHCLLFAQSTCATHEFGDLRILEMRFRIPFLAIFLLSTQAMAAPNSPPTPPSTAPDEPYAIAAALAAPVQSMTCKKDGEECVTHKECCVGSPLLCLFPSSLDDVVTVQVKQVSRI